MKKILTLVMSFVMLVGVCIQRGVEEVSATTGADIKIGEYITMGQYYGKPILWRCVDIDENGPLMLSDRIICYKPFDANGDNMKGSHGRGYRVSMKDILLKDKEYSSCYWGDSNIRDWLNSSAGEGNVVWSCGNPPNENNVYEGYNDYANESGFLSHFNSKEIQAIKTVRQKSLLSPIEYTDYYVENFHICNLYIDEIVSNYDSAYSEQVIDKVFLLDEKQVYMVYKNLGDYYKAKPTSLAVNNSEYKSEEMTSENYCCYWLRSPGACHGDNACSSVRIVKYNGTFDGEVAHSDCYGIAGPSGQYPDEEWDTDYRAIGIRPAFYLNESAVVTKVNPADYGGAEYTDTNYTEDFSEQTTEANYLDYMYDVIESEYSESSDYIYDEEKKVDIPVSTDLSNIKTKEDAEKELKKVIESLSSSDKETADGKNKIVLLGETLIEIISKTTTKSNTINVNDSTASSLIKKANSMYDDVKKGISGINTDRQIRKNIVFETSNNNEIHIVKEKMSGDIDGIKVYTPYIGFEFAPDDEFDITVSVSDEKNGKVYIKFNNGDSDKKIKIIFVNASELDECYAISGTDGKIIVGVYNSIRGELAAKVNKTGTYSLVKNEKDFLDISTKSNEMQEAIRFMAAKGIINGISDYYFAPDSKITRAEIAAIILRTLSKLDENEDGKFADVDKNDWFFGTAGSSKKLGIIRKY